MRCHQQDKAGVTLHIPGVVPSVSGSQTTISPLTAVHTEPQDKTECQQSGDGVAAMHCHPQPPWWSRLLPPPLQHSRTHFQNCTANDKSSLFAIIECTLYRVLQLAGRLLCGLALTSPSHRPAAAITPTYHVFIFSLNRTVSYKNIFSL